MDSKLAVSVDEAAAMVGLSRAAFYPLVMGGSVRSIKVGTRRLVPVAAIEDWLEASAGVGN